MDENLHYDYTQPSLRCTFVKDKYGVSSILNEEVNLKLDELEANNCTVVDIDFIRGNNYVLIKYFKNT